MSSAVNQSFQSTRVSMPSALASAGWAENRSGRSSAPGFPALASCSWPPMAALLVMLVTLSRMPFSLPTVSLNSVSRRFMGESACSPYTCQMLSMVGSLAESRVLLPPQPARARLGRTAASFKNVLRSMFVIPFRILQPGGKPAKEGPQRPALAGSRPKSPQFWAFWGDFLRGKPQSPKNFFGIAPQKRLFWGGNFFSGMVQYKQKRSRTGAESLSLCTKRVNGQLRILFIRIA